jgi:Protease inhibitor Inh
MRIGNKVSPRHGRRMTTGIKSMNSGAISWLLSGLLTLGTITYGARAQVSDAVKALVGAWEISNADRDKICNITLKADAAFGGFKLDFDKACIPNLPMLKDVIAWKIGPTDEVQLLDPRGRTLVEFTELESGMWETERPGEGVFFMQTPSALGPPPRTASDVAGDWAVVHGGTKPVCMLTLLNTPTALDDLVLKVNPPCDGFINAFGPTSWQMDRGELLIKSPRGRTWRFEEGDNNTWQRVPESADPVMLVKP